MGKEQVHCGIEGLTSSQPIFSRAKGQYDFAIYCFQAPCPLLGQQAISIAGKDGIKGKRQAEQDAIERVADFCNQTRLGTLNPDEISKR